MHHFSAGRQSSIHALDTLSSDIIIIHRLFLHTVHFLRAVDPFTSASNQGAVTSTHNCSTTLRDSEMHSRFLFIHLLMRSSLSK